MRRLRWCSVPFAAAIVGAALAAEARNDPNVVHPPDPDATPAVRYAELDRTACEEELRRRAVPYAPVAEARGVLAPVRLTGPLRGVSIHSPAPERVRATSTIEIMDCRLVLALDDLAQLLAKHDVVEIIHLSAYRPPSKRKVPPGSGRLGRRHQGGLALDAAKFVRRDGTVLDVQKDFHGRIGSRTCPPPANATELRALACEIADAHLFHVELTPDYNWQHRNHFHLEVTPSVKWFLVH